MSNHADYAGLNTKVTYNMMTLIKARPMLPEAGLASIVERRPMTKGIIMATTATSVMNMEIIKDT